MKKDNSRSLLVLLFATGNLVATERGAFPAIGIGARPLAMAGAFTAIADSADALYWNPAGAVQLVTPQISSMQTALFGMGINYNWFSFVQPLGKFALGLGYIGLDASEAFGEFPYREGSYLLSFSGSLGENLSWGFNGKYNYLKGGSELVNSSQTGFGLDAGLLWRKDKLQVGVVVRDLGTKLSGKIYEDEAERAAETEIIPDLTLAAAYSIGKATWAAELGEVANSPMLRLGAEYKVNNNISVRAGYTSGSFTGGIGVATGKWLIDYAYNTHQAGDAQRFSLGVKF